MQVHDGVDDRLKNITGEAPIDDKDEASHNGHTDSEFPRFGNGYQMKMRSTFMVYG